MKTNFNDDLQLASAILASKKDQESYVSLTETKPFFATEGFQESLI